MNAVYAVGMRQCRSFAVVVLLVCATSSAAFAWGTKEHVQLTRIAAARLIADDTTPPAMRQWLRDATPGVMDMAGERRFFLETRHGIVPRGVDGIPYWSVAPDLVALMDQRKEKVAPFGVPEQLLHYVDLELFLTGDGPRAYRHDLSGKPKLADIPRDMPDARYQQAGMLAFRLADCYEKLVAQFRAGRMNDKPGQLPRDEHAAKWAGYLAHYLADNTQPQHATIDFKSSAYFADKRNAPNVHAQLEYMMADDDADDHLALREEFWPLFVRALEEVRDPIGTDDLFVATNEVALASYDALPLIGTAAMAAMKQGGTPDAPAGAAASEKFDLEVFFRHRGQHQGREMSVMEMKARQQAWAVKRIERVWRRAWDEGHATGAR
jgi:hypothetical protein